MKKQTSYLLILIASIAGLYYALVMAPCNVNLPGLDIGTAKAMARLTCLSTDFKLMIISVVASIGLFKGIGGLIDSLNGKK
jgi:hypothetical protein